MAARRLVTALLLALVVSGLFTFWLSRRLAKPHAAEAATHHYVAASANLDAGVQLASGNLKMIDWPSSAPLEGSFVKPEDVVGRTLLSPLASGQPIVDRQLSAPGAGVGLSAKIPDGMRAISLRDDEVVGVAGFLLPGTRVDVLVTYRQGESAQTVTSVVLQDVQVLAAGQKLQADPDGKAATANVVTLLVSPDDAQKVMLATAQGTLHFVLRNSSDHDIVATSPSKISLMGGNAPPQPALNAATNQRRSSLASDPTAAAARSVAPEKKAYVITTLRGDKATEEKFQ